MFHDLQISSSILPTKSDYAHQLYKNNRYVIFFLDFVVFTVLDERIEMGMVQFLILRKNFSSTFSRSEKHHHYYIEKLQLDSQVNQIKLSLKWRGTRRRRSHVSHL